MRIPVLAFVLLACVTVAAQPAPPVVPAETLLDRAVLTALDEELSGVAAKDHVGRLTQLHRVPASPGFHEAIEYVMDRARAAGLSDVHVENVSRRRHDLVRHAARQSRLARRGRLARRSAAAAAADHLVRRRAAGGGGQQRERGRHGGAGRRRRRHAAQRLRRQGRARQAGAVRRHAVGVPPAGGRGARRRRAGQLQLESGQRVVARRSGSDPLGPSRFARAQECVRDHDLGPRGARAAAAAGARRAHHASRRGPRAQRRQPGLRDAGRRPFPAPMPRLATSCSAATSITRSRAPTTTPAAAPPTSRSRARSRR